MAHSLSGGIEVPVRGSTSRGKEKVGNRCADPSARAAPASFEVHDGAFVHAEPASQLDLGHPRSTTCGLQSLARVGPGRLRIEPEEADDPAKMHGERPGTACFPQVNRLLPDPEGLGDGSLRMAAIETMAPEVLAERPWF